MLQRNTLFFEHVGEREHHTGTRVDTPISSLLLLDHAESAEYRTLISLETLFFRYYVLYSKLSRNPAVISAS